MSLEKLVNNGFSRLKWKMACIWGVPIDHPWVINTNEAQWYYYAKNLAKDEEEKIKLIREILKDIGWRLRPEVAREMEKHETETRTYTNVNFEELIKKGIPEGE
jgi:hypothetical protein